jgi:GTP-binding protein
MLPVFTLVGRPNVGKSTLFNRLTRTRDALVADFPGLTRDRQYGVGRIGPGAYIVVDTGGLSGAGEGVESLMELQVALAIEEADHLLFMVDAREGCSGADLDIAARLRRTGKPVTLVINKVDRLDPELASADFHQLGLGEPVAIAAVQGRGVSSLMNQVFAHLEGSGQVLGAREEPGTALTVGVPGFPNADLEGEVESDEATDSGETGAEAASGAEEDRAEGTAIGTQGTTRTGPPIIESLGEGGIKVAVVGRPNVGKSTLINRILGEERLVAFDQPGTTRDSIFIPFSRAGKDYTLIDTAGMRRRARVQDFIEKFSAIKTLQAIEACNVVILVLDARQGIGEQDATLASHVVESGRSLVIAINKWDGLTKEQRDAVREAFQRKLAFLDFAAVHFISALHGSGVGLLLDEVDHAYANAVRHLPTPELTRLLQDLVQEHQPPLVNGRRIKLRYAHQGGRNPPIIVIHGNQTEELPESYRRYLVNRFRKLLKLEGTPLRLELRTGENPYEGRHNPLNRRQIKQRQRLKDFVRRKGRGRGSS